MILLGNILPWIQIILALLVCGLILIQQNEASLGGAFGGSDTSGAFHKKRGSEKVIFNTTIIVVILFVASALLTLFI